MTKNTSLGCSKLIHRRVAHDQKYSPRKELIKNFAQKQFGIGRQCEIVQLQMLPLFHLKPKPVTCLRYLELIRYDTIDDEVLLLIIGVADLVVSEIYRSK
jgi:hypothetical protein